VVPINVLASLARGHVATITRVDGERLFRRRLLEIGLTPGTPVRVLSIAPLGDPIEIELRNSRLSIRRHEANRVEVAE